jgi:hypothetical protein
MLNSKAEENELFVNLDLDGRTYLKQNIECRLDPGGSSHNHDGFQ